jgi:hypothetical protein
MTNCLICEKPIHWDDYNQDWVHTDSAEQHAAESKFWSL